MPKALETLYNEAERGITLKNCKLLISVALKINLKMSRNVFALSCNLLTVLWPLL
jgi:hypothetical protein